MAVGSTLGAGLVSGFMSLPLLVSSRPDQAQWLFTVTFVVSGICWTFGLIAIGVPFWITLHRSGRSGPKDAALLGAAATFCVSILLSLALSRGVTLSSVDGRVSILDGERTLYGWLTLLHGATLMSLAGVAVAVTVWWISYPRLKPPPAPRV